MCTFCPLVTELSKCRVALLGFTYRKQEHSASDDLYKVVTSGKVTIKHQEKYCVWLSVENVTTLLKNVRKKSRYIRIYYKVYTKTG